MSIGIGNSIINGGQVPKISSGTSLPTTGNAYELFLNTGTGIMYYYNGSAWAALSGGGSSYIFQAGLTNTSGVITANTATGISGGQSIYGGVNAGEFLQISSTTNSTKGNTQFDGNIIIYGSTGDFCINAVADSGYKFNCNGTSIFTKNVQFGNNGINNVDLLWFGSLSGRLILNVPATITNYTWKFPSTSGTSGQALITDGLGNTSWAAITPTSYTGLVETITLNDISNPVGNNTYTLDLSAFYGYTINSIVAVSGGGSANMDIRINGINVTGLTGLSVSLFSTTATATGANTVVIGNKVTCVLSGTSGSFTNFQLNVKITRT